MVGLRTAPSLERCPLFGVSFIERLYCTYIALDSEAPSFTCCLFGCLLCLLQGAARGELSTAPVGGVVDEVVTEQKEVGRQAVQGSPTV